MHVFSLEAPEVTGWNGIFIYYKNGKAGSFAD
jgi:hypothetical protein